MHWLMVLCFAGAWLARNERWRQLHATLGYTLASLVAARWSGAWSARGMRASHRSLQPIVVGLPARLTQACPAPPATIRPARSRRRLAGARGLDHRSGLGRRIQWGGEWLGGARALASGMLAVVGLHLLGVVAGSLAHREPGARDGHRPQGRLRPTRSPAGGAPSRSILITVARSGLSNGECADGGRTPPAGLATATANTTTMTTTTEPARAHPAG
jgi:hypothetical protein